MDGPWEKPHAVSSILISKYPANNRDFTLAGEVAKGYNPNRIRPESIVRRFRIMKIARFRADRRVAFGAVMGEEIVERRGSIYTRFRLTDTHHRLSDVKLLPPTEPEAIWGPGLNFADHVGFASSMLGEKIPLSPDHPEPWHKGRNALTGPEDPIILPRDSDGDLHYEGEAVAVIGKNCRRITPAQAGRYILGYTCGNDVSERSWQSKDFSFWRAKGSDTFAPVGPWIETDINPQDLEVIVRLNGEEVQRAHTKDMLFTFAEIVSYISQQVTLHPGDLVFSGTTGTTKAMKPGDWVEVDIPGIGVLRNPIVEEFDASAL